MKKVKNHFTSVLVIVIILMFSSCLKPGQLESPVINAGNNSTIILPQSSFTLKGEIIKYGGSRDEAYHLVNVKWILDNGPANVTIEHPSSLLTNVIGLTHVGFYRFLVTCTFAGPSPPVTEYDDIFVEVRSDTSTHNINTFTISPNIYTVKEIKKIENYISARSFRNGADSGSVTFFFKSANDIPASGTTREYKVVPLVTTADEVRVGAVRITGNNGKVYDCLGTDNVKATVSVNTSGKISIKMPDAVAKKLLEPDTIKISADVNEQ